MSLTYNSPVLMISIIITTIYPTAVAGQNLSRENQTSQLEFRGNEKHGLAMATISQTGAVSAKIRFTIKNKLGKTVGYIKGKLGRHSERNAMNSFDAGFIKLKPGVYYIAGYRGDVVKKATFGTRNFRFYKKHTAFRFRVSPGLTAYLGNIKFDFTRHNSTRVSVIDMIVRDLAWAQRLQPKINFLTLDRQVIDPRRAHRHRQLH